MVMRSVAALVFVLFATIATIATTGIVQADEHAALKEENTQLQQQLSKASADNDHLRARLRRAIANAKSTKNALKTQLHSAETGRNVLREKLLQTIGDAKSEKSELQSQLASAAAERRNLSDRLRRAIANAKSTKGELKAELSSAQSERDTLRNRLRRAIANAKSTKSALNAKLHSAETGRNVLREKLLQAIADKKSTENAHKAQLASVESKNKVLSDRLRRAIANAKSTKNDLRQQLAANDVWAFNVGSSLQSSIGGLQGTEVRTGADGRVNVQIGNNGLFNISSAVLSNNGKSLLAQIAEQLIQQDANITVIGHTDNVPVGKGGRYASNEELSFARAVSTLQFLRSEGVPVEKLSAAGFGADYPIASNETDEGRRQNRRVELMLSTQ